MANILVGEIIYKSIQRFDALVRFSGDTASFPALKRNSAVLEARLADDSAYAIMRGDTPVGVNDLTTKNYVDTLLSGSYLALDCSNDPLTGELETQNLVPDGDATRDIGSATAAYRTLYLENMGGRVIDLEDATTTSGPTNYTIWAGGGSGQVGTPGGGTFLVDFNSITQGTGSENQYVIDFGLVDFATSVHHYVFRSTGNAALLGDISVSTEFGGALGPGNIGFRFENTGSFNYKVNIDTRMGTAFVAGVDPQGGVDNWRKNFSIEMDGLLQYRQNYANWGWHGFEMNPSALSPVGGNYSLVYIAALADRLDANRTARHGLRVIAPATDLNGFTLNYAANIAVIGQPTVGTYNAGIYLGNSAKLVLSNGNTGNGPSMWGIVFGADILVNEPLTANSAYWHLSLPSGTNTNAEYRAYNQSNILGGAYSWCTFGISAAVASVMVGQQGAATTPPTDLDIGSAASATSFADINFKIQGVTEFNMTATALTISDANNIVVGTTTGTKIGTATTQKLGFYNATPVVQATALTAALTQITHTGPAATDYAIAAPVNGGWGFSNSNEFETIMSVILNLQTRVDELETKLQTYGLLA